MKSKTRYRLKVVDEEGRPTETEEVVERPPSLVGLIDDHLEARTIKQEFFRPSMLFGCDRANVFHYKQSAPFHPQRQGPRMQRILDNGTAIHEVIQGYLSNLTEWYFVKESRVLKKVAGAWIRGSCDGVLIHRETLYKFAIEIKTISHDEFLKLTKPKPWHIRQASVYAKLQGLRFVVILYWDKNTHNLKEFTVEVDEELWKEVRGRVKKLIGFVERRELPEFNAEQCDPTFCQYVDHCAKRGGRPELAGRKWAT